MKTKNLFLIALGIVFSFNYFAQSIPYYIPKNGLVGWWPFNGNANDESGNNNNGTVNGASLTTDRFEKEKNAYSFDGVSNVIYLDSFFLNNNLNKMSYSVWFKRATNSESSGRKTIIVQKSQDGIGYSNMISYDVKENESPLYFYNYWPQNNYYISQSSVIPTENIWYNVVTTRDSVSMKIYINGILQNTKSFIHGIENAKDLVIGGHWDYNNNKTSENFKGKIDDIGIWNRALTQQEITDIYNGNICYQQVTVTDTLIINTNLVSYNPITFKNTIKIYPNPANDHITIDYGNFTSLNGYQLKIINSLSQQVFQTNISQKNDYLNLTTWGGNGLYFVQIIDPQGNIIDIKKIVLE